MLDSIEIKELAIICLEHEKLSIENPLLKQQISSLEELNELYLKNDSIRLEEIKLAKKEIISNQNKIEKLKSSQKKTIFGSSVGAFILFIIGLLL